MQSIQQLFTGTCCSNNTDMETKNFTAQFSDLLTEIIPSHNRVLIAGDLNIHVDNPTRAFESEFLDLIESYGLTQHVSGPTHSGGHTLDLVLSVNIPISDVETMLAHADCDHKAVLFTSSLSIPPATQSSARLSRFINTHTAPRFSLLSWPPKTPGQVRHHLTQRNSLPCSTPPVAPSSTP